MAVRAIRVLARRRGLPDAGSEPVSSTQRRAFDLVSAGFGPGYNGQLSVVVDLSDAPDPHRAVEKIAISLGGYDGVASVAPAALSEAGDTAVISLVPTTGPSAAETEDLVNGLRDELRPELEAATGASFFVAGSDRKSTRLNSRH